MIWYLAPGSDKQKDFDIMIVMVMKNYLDTTRGGRDGLIATKEF